MKIIDKLSGIEFSNEAEYKKWKTLDNKCRGGDFDRYGEKCDECLKFYMNYRTIPRCIDHG